MDVVVNWSDDYYRMVSLRSRTLLDILDEKNMFFQWPLGLVGRGRPPSILLDQVAKMVRLEPLVDSLILDKIAP